MHARTLAELERQIADLQAVNEELRLLADLVQAVDQGIGLINQVGVILYANPLWAQTHGFAGAEEMLGQDLFGLLLEQEQTEQAAEQVVQGQPWHGEVTGRRLDGSTFPADMSLFALDEESGPDRILGLFLHDITERKQMEADLRVAYEEQARAQEELIKAQRKIISELSTPVIPLMEGILVLPVIGSVDSERARRITEVVLEEVSRYRARVMIMDITGVPVVDTAVANALIRTATATRLLGAETVLVGITPAVAQTVIQLGVDLEGLTTRADLQSGVEYALKMLGQALVRASPATRISAGDGQKQKEGSYGRAL